MQNCEIPIFTQINYAFRGIKLQLSGSKGRNLKVNFLGYLNNNPNCMDKLFHLGGLRVAVHLAPMWTIVKKQNRRS